MKRFKENPGKITSFFRKRSCISISKSVPVFHENSVDVDDPDNALAVTTLVPSSSSQVPSNPISVNSSEINPLPQVPPALSSLMYPTISQTSSNIILDEISSLPQISSTVISLGSPSTEASNNILDSSTNNNSLLQMTPAVESSSINKSKRYYREEWKIVPNDKKATEDRVQNLVIDAEDPWGMWCKVCTQFAPELGTKYVTNFVKNSLNLKPPRPKKETVNIHFASNSHVKCLAKAKFHKQPTSAPIYQKMTEINSLTFLRMKNIMRIVFYFAIKDRAGNEFVSECELQKMNGVDLGNTYQNHISFTVLLKYVAKSLQNNVICALNKTKIISIMTDGSTTKKSAEFEAVMLRHINDENLVNNSFIGLCEIENSTAAGLANAITNCLNSAGLMEWEKKVVCITVDGASVNVGKNNGLVKLIDAPIYIHCFNHVLDLCLKDSIKQNSEAMKAITFIKNISSMYRSSPKLTRELNRAGEVLNTKLLSFKPICETRWADSLENAVLPVVRNYTAVVQHLTDIVSEHSVKYTSNIKSSAKGLLQDMTTFETMHFFYAFSDFIALYSNASKYLETADIDIAQSEDCIRKLQLELVKFGEFGELISSAQRHLTTFLNSLEHDESGDENVFHGTILHKEKPKRSCNSNKIQNSSFKELCEVSNKIIKKRFSSNSAVLNVSKILNTAYFPPVLTENFGETEIIEFCKIFNIPVDNTVMEWREFRNILSEYFRPEISLKDLCIKLKTNLFKNMQLMSNIVEIILAIPPSNAEVERVWSSMKQTLDDRSLLMSKDTLQHRLQIKQAKITLNEFDPSPSVDLWWSDSIRSRRPNFKN